MNFLNNFTFFDCEKLIDEYSLYDEKIVLGNIIQIYYFIESYQCIKDKDNILINLSKKYNGNCTGQECIINGRRDIDFEFNNIENANKFILKIEKTVDFFIHKGISIKGDIIKKPTLLELEERKNKLKILNCGSFDITGY